MLTYLVRASCIFCAHELLSCAHKLLSSAHKLLSCAHHELLSLCAQVTILWTSISQITASYRSLPTRIFWYLDFGPRFLKPQVFTHPNNLAWVTHGQGLYVGKSFSVGNGHVSPKSGGGGWYFDFGPRFLKSQEFTHPDFWYELPIGYPCQTTWPGKPL